MIPSSHAHSSCDGFTLVELVATIVVLGILSVVALPRLLSDPEFNQRGFAEELASSMRYSQRIATASGCEVSFTVSAAGYSAFQRSSLQDCIDETGGWITPVLRTDGEPLSASTPSQVAISPNTTIVFGADGSTRNPVPTLTIGAFNLTVDQGSGTVSVTP